MTDMSTKEMLSIKRKFKKLIFKNNKQLSICAM